MSPPPPRVIALQGAPSPTIQRALADFAARRRASGWRVAGLVEEQLGPPGSGCTGQGLRDLTTGAVFPIDQDLGRDSTACHLDSSGVAAACMAALSAIEAGCDLVVISKFGKLEAARGGLIDAFRAAVEREVPVLTAVAPALAAPWQAFAGEMAAIAAPDETALEAWWQAVRPVGRRQGWPRLSAS
ncbi:DUF2478 domain-containing protein [Ancylobacter lacus]|uniref:DUF2478 domain-containing protein n=1 Tax=Ancylobacter lacus TaxID=2579970 RepID=UPI001BCEED77|nr:DUF2478 domain-containing protein [Ancylobacter lacus]MBS7537788.1 DUF2478 domain-containing protein [Ancylobacter lacus]